MSQRLETSGENVWIKSPEYNFLDNKYPRSLKPSALIWEYEKVQKIPDSLITPNDRWDILLKYSNNYDLYKVSDGMKILLKYKFCEN